MKLHEMYPHNKFLFYIGAILGFIGTYLDNTKKVGFGMTMFLIITGLICMLLSFRKPKQHDDLV